MGQRAGPNKGKEYPVAADQYFHRRGGHFAVLTAGNITLCSSNLQPIGWVEPPKDTSGYSCWKSNAVAETDKVFMNTDYNAVYRIPALETTASLAASQIGQSMKLVTSGSTYTSVQKALVTGTTAAGVLVVDVDLDNKTVDVKLHPDYIQQ